MACDAKVIDDVDEAPSVRAASGVPAGSSTQIGGRL